MDMEEFEKAFDKGLDEASAMGKKATRSTIINLCQAPKKPTDKRPSHLGKLAFVPILDNSFSAIHKVEGVETCTVPVINTEWNESDPNSPQYYWRTYTAIPDYAYKCPLTESERERIKGLYDLIKDYNNTFGTYGNSVKTVYFMKAFIIKLNSKVSGNLYEDIAEPVIIQHSSSEFPKSFTEMIKTQDEWGKEWRKKLFLPDGDITNVVVCTTSRKDIGYNVTFDYMKDVATGKNIPRATLEKWMDFDKETIGIDVTVADMTQIQNAVDAINADWDRKEGQANDQLQYSSHIVDNGADSPAEESSPEQGVQAGILEL